MVRIFSWSVAFHGPALLFTGIRAYANARIQYNTNCKHFNTPHGHSRAYARTAVDADGSYTDRPYTAILSNTESVHTQIVLIDGYCPYKDILVGDAFGHLGGSYGSNSIASRVPYLSSRTTRLAM